MLQYGMVFLELDPSACIQASSSNSQGSLAGRDTTAYHWALVSSAVVTGGRVTIIGHVRGPGRLRDIDGACLLLSQVAVLLQRAPVLWQSTSVRNHPSVWENTAALSLHSHETTAPGTSETGERQTATWKTNFNPHPFPKVREHPCWSLILELVIDKHTPKPVSVRRSGMPAKSSQGRGRRDPLLLSSPCGSFLVLHNEHIHCWCEFVLLADMVPLAPAHPTWILVSGSRNGVVLCLVYLAAGKLEEDGGSGQSSFHLLGRTTQVDLFSHPTSPTLSKPGESLLPQLQLACPLTLCELDSKSRAGPE